MKKQPFWASAVEGDVKHVFRCETMREAQIVVSSIEDMTDWRWPRASSSKKPIYPAGQYTIVDHTIFTDPEFYVAFKGSARTLAEALKPLQDFLKNFEVTSLRMDIHMRNLPERRFKQLQRLVPGNVFSNTAILNAATEDGFTELNLFREVDDTSPAFMEHLKQEIDAAIANNDLIKAEQLRSRLDQLEKKLKEDEANENEVEVGRD